MAITSVKNILARTINLASPNGSTSIYAQAADLPLTNNTIGAHAFVQTTNRLYVWNGQGWYNIALVNQTPTITVGADASYNLASDGTPTVIGLTAVDPEGLPVTWSYELTSGTLGNTTVGVDGNVFTVTPSTVISDNGVFSLTFKASDGVNISTDIADFALAIPIIGETHGWFGGGLPGPVSTVDRIDYTTDTGTAGVRGPLSLARRFLAATGNTNYGWFGGGYVDNDVSTVDRIDYAADTGTAGVRGPLSSIRRWLAATGNTNYGWFGGGFTTGLDNVSRVDRIDYAADTGTAGVRGPLSLARYYLAATGNANYGWFGGGVPGSYTSTIDRIDYADDTATAGVRGPLSSARAYLAATGNDDYGWFGGGYPGPVSRVDRIDYTTDTGTAGVRGPLSLARCWLAATGNSDYGWFGGGYPGPFSTVDRIDYAADTGTAAVRGPLSLTRNDLAATGGYPG